MDFCISLVLFALHTLIMAIGTFDLTSIDQNIFICRRVDLGMEAEDRQTRGGKPGGQAGRQGSHYSGRRRRRSGGGLARPDHRPTERRCHCRRPSVRLSVCPSFDKFGMEEKSRSSAPPPPRPHRRVSPSDDGRTS